MPFQTSSPFYHHDLIPNRPLQTVYWGPIHHKVATNVLGFRDAFNREVPLLNQKYRLLFIGDSFTQGVGIDYPETFVGLIDSHFKESEIEVLNAGVASYSPIIYYRKVKYLIEERMLRFNELIVFLDISDIEDEGTYKFDFNANVISDDRGLIKRQKALTARDDIKNTIKNFIYENTRFTAFLTTIFRRLYKGKEIFYDVNNRRSLWTVDKQVFDEYGNGLDP